MKNRKVKSVFSSWFIRTEKGTVFILLTVLLDPPQQVLTARVHHDILL